MILSDELNRSILISVKPDKQVFALREEGRAISVLFLPDREALDVMLRQREKLILDAKDCTMLNLPRNQRVYPRNDGFILVEDMVLCSDSGDQKRWSSDLLEGIRQMHEIGWVHLDIKPEHLLYGNGCWQLHDFDGAMPIGAKFNERDITWAYAPPDVMWHTRAQASDDLYAAALMLYRMRNNGKLPFERRSENCATVLRYISPLIPISDSWGCEAQWFFRKALSWNRRKRFHSVDVFIKAFERVELMWKAGE